MAAKALESIFGHINHYRILYFEETLVTIAEKNSKFCHQYNIVKGQFSPYSVMNCILNGLHRKVLKYRAIALKYLFTDI